MPSLTDTPTHLLWLPGDKRALCGHRKGETPGSYVWAPFAQSHVRGWGAVLCEACLREAHRNEVPTDGGTDEVPEPPARRRYPS